MAGARDRDITDAELEKIKAAQKAAADKAAVDNATPDKKAEEDKKPAYSELTPADRKDMTRDEKLDAIKKEREDRLAEQARERAASNPEFDFTNRPAAPEPDENYIFYYSWIGGVNSGSWKLYRAPRTPENEAKYGSRRFAGETQATERSAVGAGGLKRQPQPVKDKSGKIVGWVIPGGNGAVLDTNGRPVLDGSGKPLNVASLPQGSSVSNASGSNELPSWFDNASEDGGTIDSPSGYGPSSAAYEARKSAYDLLYAQFKQYGLESLVEPLKALITSNTPASEFIIKLRETEAYKKRFAGNAQRIAKGLAAISEAEYIGLEDQYQNIMRNYGLPDTYWKKDAMGTQEGFTNFIGNDVSAAELEDRIMNAQKRVINSNPEVSKALKQFYPEITNGDILAYTLDPTKGLDVIKRKITAAEIGGAALAQGLETGMTRAEELAKYGVTKEQATQGYQTAAQIIPRGGQLAAIYGESPYDQTTAEQEIFGLAGSAEAAKKRKKLVGLETAAFSGQAGTTQGALGRERAGII